MTPTKPSSPPSRIGSAVVWTLVASALAAVTALYFQPRWMLDLGSRMFSCF